MTNDLQQSGTGGPRRARVLSGGGARGAYEAGVLAYIFQELPPEIISKGRVSIFCGTSIGAMHACYLTGTAHIHDHDIDRLLNVWRAMRIATMLRLGMLDMARIPLELRRLMRNELPGHGLFINSARLEEIAVRDLPWAQVRYNLNAGTIPALPVSATHIHSGKRTVVVDSPPGEGPTWPRDPRIAGRSTRIGPQHAMASAAIPFLFPVKEIDGAYYCDGGVRLNTPLSPALRLGADRVLVMGLRGDDLPGTMRAPISDDNPEPYPGPLFLAGKLADSIMLDRLDYDLIRLDGFNHLLEYGRETRGETFREQLNETATRVRGAPYREVGTVHIKPSRDIGEMANEFVDVFRASLGGLAGWLFARISSQHLLGESDLLSYLLFDGRLAAALIELGRADADAARQDLIDFFKD